MGAYDWRLADTNVWKVERMLLDYPHRHIATSDARFKWLKKRATGRSAKRTGKKPLYYRGPRTVDARLPREFGTAILAQDSSRDRNRGSAS